MFLQKSQNGQKTIPETLLYVLFLIFWVVTVNIKILGDLLFLLDNISKFIKL
jgi:hypothetical protein